MLGKDRRTPATGHMEILGLGKSARKWSRQGQKCVKWGGQKKAPCSVILIIISRPVPPQGAASSKLIEASCNQLKKLRFAFPELFSSSAGMQEVQIRWGRLGRSGQVGLMGPAEIAIWQLAQEGTSGCHSHSLTVSPASTGAEGAQASQEGTSLYPGPPLNGGGFSQRQGQQLP